MKPSSLELVEEHNELYIGKEEEKYDLITSGERAFITLNEINIEIKISPKKVTTGEMHICSNLAAPLQCMHFSLQEIRARLAWPNLYAMEVFRNYLWFEFL